MEGLVHRSRETGQGCEGTGIKTQEKLGPGHWDQYRWMEGLGQEQWGRDTEYT